MLRVLSILNPLNYFLPMASFPNFVASMCKGVIGKANAVKDTAIAVKDEVMDWCFPDQIVEYTVQLSQLQFPDEQPVDSNKKTKYNADRSVVTRICDDYSNAFVCLRNTLKQREFILIQILKVDLQHIGGLRLYLEEIPGEGHRDMFFSDSTSERSDCIIFWMDSRNKLYCEKKGKIQTVERIHGSEAKHLKLVCEMYGPVQQIRAYVGRLDKTRKSHVPLSTPSGDDSVDHSSVKLLDAVPCSGQASLSPPLCDDSMNDSSGKSLDAVPSSGHASFSTSSCEDSKNGSSGKSLDAVPSLEDPKLQNKSPEEPKSNDLFLRLSVNCYQRVVKKIIINNLPPIEPSSSKSVCCVFSSRVAKKLAHLSKDLTLCSDTNGTNEPKVETCEICMDKDADTVIIPCGHLISCYECASRVTTRCGSACPMCRAEIEDCRKIFDRKAQCQSCRMNSANVLLIPCGDMCLCDSCSAGAKNCPVCLMFVNMSQKVIFCTS